MKATWTTRGPRFGSSSLVLFGIRVRLTFCKIHRKNRNQQGSCFLKYDPVFKYHGVDTWNCVPFFTSRLGQS